VKQPAASKVFQRYRLDFCCHGNRPLREACDEYGLAPESVLAEIESEGRKCGEVSRWEERPLSELVAYIVNYYHRRLREELPLLVAMASRVEQVHREKAASVVCQPPWIHARRSARPSIQRRSGASHDQPDQGSRAARRFHDGDQYEITAKACG
jgi:hypothetical protein